MRKALGMTSQYRVSTTQFSVPKKRESFHKKSMIIIIDNRLFSDNDRHDCHPAIVLVVVNVKKKLWCVWKRSSPKKRDGACVTLRNQLKDLKSVWWAIFTFWNVPSFQVVGGDRAAETLKFSTGTCGAQLHAMILFVSMIVSLFNHFYNKFP